MAMHQNIDYCLLNPKPEGELDQYSSADDSWHYHEWFRTNKMAKNVLRRTMSEIVRGSVEEPEDAIDYMAAIAEKFEESEKAEGARLHKEFHELKYDGNGSVREHIMHKVLLNGKLRDLRMGVSDAQIVHEALYSLPASFSNLRTTYKSVWMRRIGSAMRLDHPLQSTWWKSPSGRRRIRTRLSKPSILRYLGNLQKPRVTNLLSISASSVKRSGT
ncbi:PREDICTED: uncharacterized protein LOC101300151 [Fragaria vesca subsp. vesca]|uniref:uncharacterized protein LOC101300151 n=1 Tax=Fragaria vesca subsp. vesca TaxID=101020 RepID=UPI0002C33C48|nr:PREDICTED: uncharacterized protein LOC101300151 [Fragaria vesca subsp. vesca]